MADMSTTRGSNRTIAAILARTICPERADWPEAVAREFLQFRFADIDLDRFHALLAKQYGEAITAEEEDQLESYLLINCLLATIHDRAHRSLDKLAAETAE